LCAAGYLVLALGDAAGAPLSLGWVLAYLLLVDLAIVLIWPAGLALISSRAPATLVGLLIGLFYLHGFFANIWVGAAGATYDPASAERFWLEQAGVAAAGGALLLILAAPLSRLAQSPRAPNQAMTTSA